MFLNWLAGFIIVFRIFLYNFLMLSFHIHSLLAGYGRTRRVKSLCCFQPLSKGCFTLCWSIFRQIFHVKHEIYDLSIICYLFFLVNFWTPAPLQLWILYVFSLRCPVERNSAEMCRKPGARIDLCHFMILVQRIRSTEGLLFPLYLKT